MASFQGAKLGQDVVVSSQALAAGPGLAGLGRSIDRPIVGQIV